MICVPGKPTGQYKYEPSAVNRAHELIGKELGMFVERYSNENFDSELAGMDRQEILATVKALVSEVGLRTLDMTDDETRAWILKHAPRVGLEVTPAPIH